MENQIIEFLGNHLMLTGIWITLGLLLLVSIKKGSASTVSSQQLVNLINREQALVLDIRSHNEFNKGHIADSKNIQMTKLSKQLGALEKWKTEPLVVVCNSGVQANAACSLLKKNNFTQVFKLQGGIQSWLGDSLPLTKS